ncbi:MAG: YdcF family protein, partial [Alphaproteobacteria bacterium]|nr:YdcF family protein [Alphaproteobacteria bacterium]
LMLGVFPTGYMLVSLLEDRFPVPELPDDVAGIIVLGGSVNPSLSQAREQVALNHNAARLTQFMVLANRYPDAKLVFTGGIGSLSGIGPTEASTAKLFFAEMGMDTNRVIFEDRSRNTMESAEYTKNFKATGDGPWVLITSARHMPRAVGLFRRAGWDVTPYPVAYSALPLRSVGFTPWFPGDFTHLNAAAYEWGGLLVAWAGGKIDDPFPAP